MNFTVVIAWRCDGPSRSELDGERCGRKWSSDITTETGWVGTDRMSAAQLRDIAIHDAVVAGWSLPVGADGPVLCPRCAALDDNHQPNGDERFGEFGPYGFDRAWLCDQVARHRTNADIAAEVGCSLSTVSAAVAIAGLAGTRGAPRPERHNKRLANRDWLQEQVDAGFTISQIAANASASRKTVVSWLHRHQLEQTLHTGIPGVIVDRDWVADRVDAGETLGAIAAAAEVTNQTVREWIRRHGLDEQWATNKARRRPRFPKLRDRDWLADQLGAGRSPASIADELGCTVRPVREALHAHRLVKPTRANPAEKQAAVQRHLDGESINRIAVSLGRKRASVSHWVIEAGHQPRLASYSDDDRRKILDRVANGERIAAVANETGIDPTTIRAWRRARSAQVDDDIDSSEADRG